jgi:hypothetical protein
MSVLAQSDGIHNLEDQTYRTSLSAMIQNEIQKENSNEPFKESIRSIASKLLSITSSENISNNGDASTIQSGLV